jgi:hypothetical protein
VKRTFARALAFAVVRSVTHRVERAPERRVHQARSPPRCWRASPQSLRPFGRIPQDRLRRERQLLQLFRFPTYINGDAQLTLRILSTPPFVDGIKAPIAMAEDLADLDERCAATEHGAGQRVAKGMRPLARRLEPGPLQAAVDDVADRRGVDEAPERRLRMEDLMAGGTYEFQSDFAKKHQAKGRAEGEAKGEAKGRAEAILDVLEARSLRVSDEARARILACTDAAQLATWVRKAVSVSSVDELF